MVLRNIRRMLGLDRIRRGGSGAAPISPELLKWFHAIGVPVLEGYGMTESAGVIGLNTLAKNKNGTVGTAIEGAELRIADDGEIQYRAGNVFQGYWKLPEKTAETITKMAGSKLAIWERSTMKVISPSRAVSKTSSSQPVAKHHPRRN